MQELINRKFSKWTVISYEGKRNTERHWYKVRCECGNESVVERNILIRGKSTQCRSCARRKWHSLNPNPAQTHGYSSPSHPYFHTYCSWCSMKRRCNREQVKDYKNYGKRGITICERWINSFDFFLEDMGVAQKSMSLDRIDVNGNYCKENCRWATIETQSNNRRDTIYHEIDEIKLSETQWARKLGLSRNKVTWWARKNGIKWVIENIDNIKKSHRGMSDSEYLKLGIDLPGKLYR